MNQISSRQNPEIKRAIKLHRRRNRLKEKKALLEGIKLFYEATRDDNEIAIERVYILNSLYESDPTLAGIVDALGSDKVVLINEPVLEALSQVPSPEGIITLISYEERSIEEEGYADLSRTQSPSYVILEDVQDPGNLGTIIRTADAAGYSAVILTEGCADPFSEKALRASMGSVFHLPVLRTHALTDFLLRLKEASFEIIGSTLDGELLSFKTADAIRPFALILGNESRGMTKSAQAYCTRLVKIPIYGQAESLNVAVAAGILLYMFT